MASGISSLWATPIPAPNVVPISDGSGTLQAWVTSGSGGIDLQTALNGLSTTQGAIIFRGSSSWQALEPGVDGGTLITHGSGFNPSWSLGPEGGIFGTWVSNVDASGGTYETDSKTICMNLSNQLEAASFFSKIVWMLPLLGANLAAARVPLIDVLGAGSSGNHNFIDADFSQSTGLQGNGSTKYLSSGLRPSDLGVSGNGGLGWWENNINLSGNVEPIGAYDNSAVYRYVLDLRTNRESIRWGNASNDANSGNSAVNGHYYGQRPSITLREIFLDGVSIATNTTSDPVSGAGDRIIIVVGSDDTSSIAPWPGRCAVAYMTDGTLTPTEIADFHTLLDTYLIIPTGR